MTNSFQNGSTGSVEVSASSADIGPRQLGRRRRRARRQASEGQVVCYARFSSDEQDSKSIDDQWRACRVHSEGKGLTIEQLYKDEAVSGTLRDRAGLNALLEDAQAGRIRVIYFFNLSRLAREMLISQSVLRRLVDVYRIRVITVTENLDSDIAGWRTIAAIFNVLHQEMLQVLRENVRNGQIGTVDDGFSVGDYRFGYTSIPSPGGETIRRAGEDKPRRVYVIQEEEAEWVRRVFHWFVIEFRSIQWIVRELNRRQVSKDHRATTSKWNRQLVISLLRSVKYIGIWPWGELENVRHPETGRVTQLPRDEEECAQWRRPRPDLRIVSDELFLEAQERLDENAARMEAYRDEQGKLRGSQGTHRLQLLTGLMICPACGSKLYVSGPHGEYLQCCQARDGVCACRTMLPRRLAEQQILEAIRQRLLDDPAWLAAVEASAVESWRELRRQQPNCMDALRRQIQQAETRIQRLMDELEDSDEPDPDIRDRLRARRQELEAARRQLAACEARERQLPSPPTRQWVVERLQRLDEVLHGNAAAANHALLQLLGGPLRLELIAEEGRKRKYFRGRFRLQTLAFSELSVPLRAAGTDPVGDNSEIILDFRTLPKEEVQIEKAWQLLQQGAAFTEIAAGLGVGKSRTTLIMKLVAQRYGDGLTPKALKQRFAQLRVRPHAHDPYVEPAMALYHAGVLIDEIAAQLGTQRKMIRQAIEAWHAAQGLPVPDGRTRRRSLEYKGRSAWETRCRHTGEAPPQAS